MDQLIKDNMGLVITIADSFYPKNQTEREDFIDAGRIGLWKALQKYDPNSGYSVSTYAFRPIQWAIIKELKNRRQTVSIENIPEPSLKDKPPLWELFDSELTLEDQNILALRQYGYKFREICDIIQKSPSSVKNRYYKIIKEMKKTYAE